LWRYESSKKFLTFTSKIRLKSETLAMKNIKPTGKKIGYFWILVLELNLDISGILAYNFFLMLFCGKKKAIKGQKVRLDF
jgi:hypothetical protein